MVELIEYSDGTKIWYKNGEFHREDGPAVIWSNGNQYWYKNGKAHNDNGPAAIYPSGNVSWWLDGVPYSFKEWIESVDISDELKVELVLRYG